MAKTVQGRLKQWQLLEVVGCGDAGEVLRVQTELGLDYGVMKRPVQNVSGGTINFRWILCSSEPRILSSAVNYGGKFEITQTGCFSSKD